MNLLTEKLTPAMGSTSVPICPLRSTTAPKLATSERKRFEDHFLGQPEHRANLKIAQALEKYLTTESVGAQSKASLPSRWQSANVLVSLFQRQPVVWVAMAAAVVIIISIITWNALQSRRGEQLQAKDPQPQTQPSEQPSSAVSPGEKEREEARTTEPRKSGEEPIKKDSGNQAERERPATFAIFEILPGGISRSAGKTNVVRITPNLGNVVLNLPLELTERYDRYQYELLTRGHIVEKRDLKPETDVPEPIVSITLPAKLLTRESYEIRLRGINAAGLSSAPSFYHFKVERAR